MTATVIELKYLKDMPAETYRSTTMFTTAEQAQAWAERNGAETVYIYQHKLGYMTCWVRETRKP
jgi:hypothetical protein